MNMYEQETYLGKLMKVDLRLFVYFNGKALYLMIFFGNVPILMLMFAEQN